MALTHFRLRVAQPTDVFTEEQVASLIGQEPAVLVAFDQRRPVARAVVVHAVTDAGTHDLYLDIEVPDQRAPYVAAALDRDPGEISPASLGYTIEAGHVVLQTISHAPGTPAVQARA